MTHPFLALLLIASLNFDKEVSGKKTEVSWNVLEKEAIVEIAGKSEGGMTSIVCDKGYNIQKYQSQNPENTHIFIATRTHDTLLVESALKGEKKSKTYDLKGKMWVQDFSFGLKPFFMSSATDCTFEIINPKDLVMRGMVATKEEIDYRVFNGIKYRARRVKVTLEGFYKKFWKAELWYDTATHNLLYYKANEGPSTPYTVLTLKELKK